MDIKEFFTQSTGKWFSQRTNHHITVPELQADKSDLWIELLPTTDSAVIQLCEQNKIDSSLASFGVDVKWEGKIGPNEVKQTGNNLMVVIPDSDNHRTGKILQQAGVGHYRLSLDGALNIYMETPTVTVQERIWFESPNLRLRTCTVKHKNGSTVASFCSEIRMGGTGK